ncbi:MAG: hypothetical protein V7776_05175 [Halopseudomonas aestusnigri]
MTIKTNTLGISSLSGFVGLLYAGEDLLFHNRKVSAEDVLNMLFVDVLNCFEQGYFSRVNHDA